MRVQAQSKHELDRKRSEQHVVGRPAKEKDVADHALLCPCKATGEKEQEGGVPEKLEPGAVGVHRACHGMRRMPRRRHPA